jgi:hypothetical protein
MRAVDFPAGCGIGRSNGLTEAAARACIPREVEPPRQIYASAADRRSGRRWTRRPRPFWVPAALLAGATTVALAAGEVLRSLG